MFQRLEKQFFFFKVLLLVSVPDCILGAFAESGLQLEVLGKSVQCQTASPGERWGMSAGKA